MSGGSDLREPAQSPASAGSSRAGGRNLLERLDFEGGDVGGVESEIDDGLVKLRTSGRPSQQDERERHLDADTTVGALRQTARARPSRQSAPADHLRRAGELERRHQAEEQGSQHGEPEREPEHLRIDLHRRIGRQRQGDERDQRVERRVGEQHAGDRAGQGQQQALGEQLPDQTPASGADPARIASSLPGSRLGRASWPATLTTGDGQDQATASDSV